jgi:putative sigma-54 modulation protein
MKYNIRGDKVTVTQSMKSYITEKLSKMDKYFENPDEITANVLVKIKGLEQIIEVTAQTKRFTLRAEESHEDFYAAVDLVIAKLERQIRKNKTRLNRNVKESVKEFNFDYELPMEEEAKETVVKRKKLEMKPMSEEEAVLEMELLGHNFFVYKDMDTNSVNVLYKRKDGDYGLIETN